MSSPSQSQSSMKEMVIRNTKRERERERERERGIHIKREACR